MIQSENSTKRRRAGLGGVDLIAQVQAARRVEPEHRENSTAVSQRNNCRGLRAYFKPLSGGRRTGLVSLDAIRTREEGQVRRGEIAEHEDFADLVASIQVHGILQPINLDWDEATDCFWIDCGHRRVAAARAAGHQEIPAVISMAGKNAVDALMTQQQLIENLQRTQLSSLDIAHGLHRLSEEGLSAAEIARSVGKSRSWVHKHLKLLELPEAILQEAEEYGVGHEVLYVLRQASVKKNELHSLLKIGAEQGRPALQRELETRAMTQSASLSRAPEAEDSPSKKNAKSNNAAPNNRQSTDVSKKALRGAARKALQATKHLLALLEVVEDDSLHGSAANFQSALSRFLK